MKRVFIKCGVLLLVALALGCGTQTPEELMLKGCKSLNQGDLIGAVLCFNKFIEKYPEHKEVASAHLYLARCRIRLEDVDLGIKEYRMLIHQYPDSEAATNASFELAGHYQSTQKPEEAEKELRALFSRSQDPKLRLSSLFQIASGYLTSASSSPEKTEAILREALQIAQTNDEKVGALFGISDAYIKCATQPEKAEKVLQEALALSAAPEVRIKLRFQIGEAYVVAKSYDRAAGIYQAIIDDVTFPEEERAFAYMLKAKCFKAKEDFSSASASLEDMRNKLPNTKIAIWSNVESSLLAKDNPKESDKFFQNALQAYQSIIEASPNSDVAAWSQTKIAEAYREIHDLAEAIQAYGKVIEQYPANREYVERSREMIKILRQEIQVESSGGTVKEATSSGP